MLGDDIREYSAQLKRGGIQRAYRGILSFMSALKASLERHYPEYALGTLYPGYMDMSYFAVPPPALKAAGLKIAIVYLHQEARFEAWLAADNRKRQREIIKQLAGKELGGLTLPSPGPGVDSIIAAIITEAPDFDRAEELIRQIENYVLDFIRRVTALLA